MALLTLAEVTARAMPKLWLAIYGLSMYRGIQHVHFACLSIPGMYEASRSAL